MLMRDERNEQLQTTENGRRVCRFIFETALWMRDMGVAMGTGGGFTGFKIGG
jgi:hypothetical protein